MIRADLSAERPGGKWQKRLADHELNQDLLDLLDSAWDDDPNERPADALDFAEKLSAHTRIFDSLTGWLDSESAAWVTDHLDGWNQNDWQLLIDRIKKSPFCPLNEADLEERMHAHVTFALWRLSRGDRHKK